ncbi:MAG: glycosyltransferase [Pseudomonadota bacterium]
MFLFDSSFAEFSVPWNLPISNRIALLTKKTSRIAYYYDKADTTTFRYRVFNMVEAINASTSISASWFFKDDLVHLQRLLPEIDTLIVCRAKYTIALAQVIQSAKAKGTRVLYDIDDLVFDIAHTQIVMDSTNQQSNEKSLDLWFAYISRIQQAASLCDGCISTNRYIGSLLSKTFDFPVYIVKNFLNREQNNYSNCIAKRKEDANFKRDSNIHIGYFSGTFHHQRDFKLVEDALISIMSKHTNVILRIVGLLDLAPCFKNFGDRIERYPLQNYLNLQQLIAEVEINISPLQDNIFTNCKSELKYFEASVVGVPTIGSPTYALYHAIQRSEIGFVANNHMWSETIEELIEKTELRNLNYTAEAMLANREYGWKSQLEIIESIAL